MRTLYYPSTNLHQPRGTLLFFDESVFFLDLPRFVRVGFFAFVVMQIGHYLDVVEASRGLLSGPGPSETDLGSLQRTATMFHRPRGDNFGHGRKTAVKRTISKAKYRSLLLQVKKLLLYFSQRLRRYEFRTLK